jgi:outer membrane protein OmpA-like peptidoglycan-associated protein
VTLGDVLFDTGKATLKPGAYSTVERLAIVLKEDPSRKVLIEGHTDNVGSDEYNQGLSERRAQSVQAALFERGVEASQISTVGKGETTPVASNDNPAGRQQNRRVELVFQEDRSKVASDTG